MYGFYIAQHHFSLEELKEASEKKLHRAVPLLEDKSKEIIHLGVEEAKKSEVGLKEFLVKFKKN